MDSLVTLFELETLSSLKTFWLVDSAIKGLSFSHDSQYLAYYCQDERDIQIEQWQKGELSFLVLPYDSLVVDPIRSFK